MQFALDIYNVILFIVVFTAAYVMGRFRKGTPSSTGVRWSTLVEVVIMQLIARFIKRQGVKASDYSLLTDGMLQQAAHLGMLEADGATAEINIDEKEFNTLPKHKQDALLNKAKKEYALRFAAKILERWGVKVEDEDEAIVSAIVERAYQVWKDRGVETEDMGFKL